jgi:hypothetical protein
MKEETLIKYLEFIKKECIRYQNDKIITDDEIYLFTIEIDRFLKKVETSKFSNDVKKVIFELDFNLDEENHHKPKYRWLNLISGYRGGEIKSQMNRKNRIDQLYNDLDAAIFKIKMIL